MMKVRFYLFLALTLLQCLPLAARLHVLSPTNHCQFGILANVGALGWQNWVCGRSCFGKGPQGLPAISGHSYVLDTHFDFIFDKTMPTPEDAHSLVLASDKFIYDYGCIYETCFFEPEIKRSDNCLCILEGLYEDLLSSGIFRLYAHPSYQERATYFMLIKIPEHAAMHLPTDNVFQEAYSLVRHVAW